MLQKTDQPFPVDRIEKASDVGIEYPVHLCAADSDNERIQRIMRAAPWPKPIRETEEIFLVDRVQHCKRCSLDDFVLQSGDREGALPPVRLGMYTRRDGSARYAPRWSRACRSSRLRSRYVSYSCHVSPSAPGAAFFLSS